MITEHKEQRTMTNISKHYAKKKRKRHNSKKTRVNFFIPRHTISIDNFLNLYKFISIYLNK